MKIKTISLVAGLALAANMGLANATELDELAEGIPAIMGIIATHKVPSMTDSELERVEGGLAWPWRKRGVIPQSGFHSAVLWLSPFHRSCLNPCPRF